MLGSSVCRVLSVARQGIELGIEYGPHAVEALLWIAETVEESVYRAGSLHRNADGIGFTLENPPLRSGAFAAVRLLWNGVPVDPARLTIRTGAAGSGRVAGTLSRDAPIDLVAGDPIELFAAVPEVTVGDSATVRLELECPAIPPLVWIEFRDTVLGG
ncbi:MAG: hypothetical protein WAK40_01290 [Thermoplasmata archaeon]